MRKPNMPTQIVLGGYLARFIWRAHIKPQLREKASSRQLARRLGVSHNTIVIWRRYL